MEEEEEEYNEMADNVSHSKSEDQERSRPSTPRWWRPQIPPETYRWEEIRRKRKLGGYPWTLLDKDDDDDFGDNLYEPVNPPPLYASGSGYANRDRDPETTSLDERMIEIPPEIEFVTSDGLDGLDLPDPHDSGIDGDREWRSFRPEDDSGSQTYPKAVFTAGIRNRDLPKHGETSSVRPLANKNISFSPDVPDDESSIQEVSSVEKQGASGESESQSAEAASSGKENEAGATTEGGSGKPSALDQLKTKAGQMKQRFSKISLPVRPKFNQWTGIKLSKNASGKNKNKKGQSQADELAEQEVPEQEVGGGWTEPLSLVPEVARPVRQQPQPTTGPVPMDIDQIDDFFEKAPQEEEAQLQAHAAPASSEQQQSQQKDDESKEKKKLADEQKKKVEEEAKRLKAEEKQQKDEELKRLREEEKAQRAREQEDLKRLKEEEKKKKEKEQEEQKRLKAEEKQRKEREKEDLKKQKQEEKLQKEKLEEEIKKVKEEEIQKAKELQAQMEEELGMNYCLPPVVSSSPPSAAELREQEEKERLRLEKEFDDDLAAEESQVAALKAKAQSKLSKLIAPPSSPKPPKTPKTPEEKKRKLIDLDFSKRFKRSKTPPSRPEPPKIKFSKTTKKPPSNQLAAQYAQELESRNAEMEVENENENERLREPQIFVTQPSVETVSSEGESQRGGGGWPSSSSPRKGPRRLNAHREGGLEEEQEEELEENRNRYSEDDDIEADEYLDAEERNQTPSSRKEQIGRKLKGFGVKSKAIAAQTGKNLGHGIKVLGHGLKEFGVNAVQEVKAKQEAVRQRDAQKRAELADTGSLDDGAYVPSQPKITFKFKKRDKQVDSNEEEYQNSMVIEPQHHDDAESRRPPIPNRGQLSQTPGGSNSYYSNEGEGHKKSTQRGRKLPRIPPDSQSRSSSHGPDPDDQRVHRSQLLGRADRDWESPLDLALSRDQSEEPGNMSSRPDSPPGSSMASSSIMQGARRPGVLEEIDSDEFFLRERGISEGEDEEEVNRFLVEELRQAFRPTMQSNALSGFDLPSPPSRPGRSKSPKKPPRKTGQDGSSGGDGPNFQTFPPQRPKRKTNALPTGYISSYMNENQEEEEVEEEELDEEDQEPQRDGEENEEETMSNLEQELLGVEDEGIRRVKEELRKIDSALKQELDLDQEIGLELGLELELEDDGRYEPVDEQHQPVKPQRSRKSRKQKKMPETPTPQAFYYNTIAANEWMRDLEGQIEIEPEDQGQGQQEEETEEPTTNANLQLKLVNDGAIVVGEPTTTITKSPVPPKRERAKSGGSRRSQSLVPEIDDSELNYVDEDDLTNDDTTLRQNGNGTAGVPLAQAESESRIHDGDMDLDDAFDDVDESGYAVVHKDLPKTFPRKNKKKRGSGSGSASGSGPSSKGNSLKRPARSNNTTTNNNNSVANANDNGNNNNGMFFSLPRYTPRTFHIVPPTRPHRNYSTLKPKRPPRNKSKSNQNLHQEQDQGQGQATASSPLQPPAVPTSPRPGSATPRTPTSSSRLSRGGRGDRDLHSEDDRPSTAIGIMAGRPLPPPPRPDRSPVPLNDLDQSSIERMVNMRHYVNYSDDVDGPPLPGMVEVVEEPFTKKNIPLLYPDGEGDGEDGNEVDENGVIRGEISSILANSDINVAVQTDPVHDEDYELNITAGSFEEQEERIEKQRSSTSRLTLSDQEPGRGEEEIEEHIPPPIPSRPLPRSSLQQQILLQQQQQVLQQQQQTPLQQQEPPQIVFPTRLHLDELEVDVLRVNDLTATILTLDQLRAPHLELNTISSRGPLSVPSVNSPHLSAEHLECHRLTSDIAETLSSSIPPPSFYNLQSPVSQVRDELCCPESETESCVPSSQPPSSEQEGVVSSENTNNTETAAASTGGSSSRPISTTRVISPLSSQGISQTSSADPDLEDIAHTSMRLGRALLRVTVRSLHAMAEYVEVAASNNPDCQEQQRSNMQVLLCLLLVLVAGIILVGRSGAVEPRWQFFLPPGDL